MALAFLGAIAWDDASSLTSSTAGSDVNAAHTHAPAAAAELLMKGPSGSSGSRVISAIISRSCGERTEDDSWAAFIKSASEGPKCDDDEVVDGCATTGESLRFFFFFPTR